MGQKLLCIKKNVKNVMNFQFLVVISQHKTTVQNKEKQKERKKKFHKKLGDTIYSVHVFLHHKSFVAFS